MIIAETSRNDTNFDKSFFDKYNIAYKVANPMKYARMWIIFVWMFPSTCFMCENVCQASNAANDINSIRTEMVFAKNDRKSSAKNVMAFTVAENGCDMTPFVFFSHVVNGNLNVILLIFD